MMNDTFCHLPLPLHIWRFWRRLTALFWNGSSVALLLRSKSGDEMSEERTLSRGAYYGFGNAGDEFDFAGPIQNSAPPKIQKRSSPSFRGSAETARSFGVQAVDRWRPWCWVRPFNGRRPVILGGGGLLQETNRSMELSLLPGAFSGGQNLWLHDRGLCHRRGPDLPEVEPLLYAICPASLDGQPLGSRYGFP